MNEHPADDKLVSLFKEWLAAFEAINPEEALPDYDVLAEIESRIAATPAEGLHGVAVKLGLYHVLNDDAIGCCSA